MNLCIFLVIFLNFSYRHHCSVFPKDNAKFNFENVFELLKKSILRKYLSSRYQVTKIFFICKLMNLKTLSRLALKSLKIFWKTFLLWVSQQITLLNQVIFNQKKSIQTVLKMKFVLEIG